MLLYLSISWEKILNVIDYSKIAKPPFLKICKDNEFFEIYLFMLIYLVGKKGIFVYFEKFTNKIK